MSSEQLGTGPTRKREQVSQPHSSNRKVGVASREGEEVPMLIGGKTSKRSAAVKLMEIGNPQTKSGRGKAPLNKGKVSRQDPVHEGLNVYRQTKWYRDAVTKGFKNQTALDRFNATVETMADEIDPSAIPVCTDCGRSDLTLCNCLIVASTTAVVEQDGALVIPTGAVNTIWRFDWVNRVKRMFIRPHFDANAPINHNIGWLTNNQLSESELLWPELLCFIRQRQNVTYMVNGKDDRMARLAHSNKLAQLFLDVMKIKVIDQLQPAMLNRVQYTVKKACDQVDSAFLMQNTNEDHSLFRAVPWARLSRVALIAIALASPTLLPRLASVSMKAIFAVWSRLARMNARILADGSVQAFRFGVNHILFTLSVLLANIWSGLVKPCSTGILQSLCSIARITCTAV